MRGGRGHTMGWAGLGHTMGWEGGLAILWGGGGLSHTMGWRGLGHTMGWGGPCYGGGCLAILWGGGGPRPYYEGGGGHTKEGGLAILWGWPCLALLWGGGGLGHTMGWGEPHPDVTLFLALYLVPKGRRDDPRKGDLEERGAGASRGKLAVRRDAGLSLGAKKRA